MIDLAYFYLGEIDGYESNRNLDKANLYINEIISKDLPIGFFLKAKLNLLNNSNSETCELYKQAFDGGYLGAGISLANEYLNGINCEKNELEAFKIYNYLFNNTNNEIKVLASHNLGYIYLNGIGVEKDIKKAKDYLIFSASNGLKESNSLLQSLN
ncbi:sel1 repeat family protein [Acinetobacter sp. 194]|uniref:tetratricopeptide repeat protein n=1 Tax=Acinetobacter shaoyimingii TaxID=2715164 RepID=UPI00140834AD|nr:SEL1-like repeat protein [Acinetobacter shaoyimingii]NHB59035.1 sel1 repeat family protein [Acinetobacter shaoyimingii]